MNRHRICFVADGRAENFRRWVRYFVDQGDEVHVLSTSPCDEIAGAAIHTLPSLLEAPTALVKRSDKSSKPSRLGYLSKAILKYNLDRHLFSFWGLLKLANVPMQVRHVQKMLAQIKPELTIAFRLQNEGYIVALSRIHPCVLFTQGSDFIHRAERHAVDAMLSARAMRTIDALITDCARDWKLAQRHGFEERKPFGIFPGNGGVNTEVYSMGPPAAQRERLVVFPRGLAPYMRFDTLLASIRELHRQPAYADVRFILLVTQAVTTVAQEKVLALGLNPQLVTVEPFLSQSELAKLLQTAAMIVSPSLTDGTPNSMLEAMACGAFPIMSDLESIREWIRPGENGMLFDPMRSDQLADCFRAALDNVGLRQQAQAHNLRLIHERADYRVMMPKARDFVLNVATCCY